MLSCAEPRAQDEEEMAHRGCLGREMLRDALWWPALGLRGRERTSAWLSEASAMSGFAVKSRQEKSNHVKSPPHLRPSLPSKQASKQASKPLLAAGAHSIGFPYGCLFFFFLDMT